MLCLIEYYVHFFGKNRQRARKTLENTMFSRAFILPFRLNLVFRKVFLNHYLQL